MWVKTYDNTLTDLDKFYQVVVQQSNQPNSFAAVVAFRPEFNSGSVALYRTELNDSSGNAKTNAVMLAEAQNAFDYVEWCLEREFTVAQSSPFICNLADGIPTKPFTYPGPLDDDDDSNGNDNGDE